MSKFKGGLDAYKQRQAETTTEVPQKEPLSESASQLTSSQNISSTAKDKANRKESKDYQQVNGYVPKQLYKKVKIALVEEERTISDLMTQLLSDWIDKRQK